MYISILNSSRFTCKANRVDLWGWKFHLIRPPEPSLGVATTFGVEVMQVNQIWLTIADKLSNAMQHNVHRTIQIGSSFTLTSSRNSGMRSYRKCKGCNQTDKRAVKSVKLKSALKSIRPTNFHTLVNQGFCGRACALGQKCNQTETFQNVKHATAFEIRMKTILDKWTAYATVQYGKPNWKNVSISMGINQTTSQSTSQILSKLSKTAILNMHTKILTMAESRVQKGP